jgi:hypothetical protein
LTKGGFQNPVAAAEHRRENREKRASCLSPRRVFCARRVRRAPIFPRSAGRRRRLRGVLSLVPFAPGKIVFARAKTNSTGSNLDRRSLPEGRGPWMVRVQRNLPWVSHPQVAVEIARKARDTI